jgi:hypothetical protein
VMLTENTMKKAQTITLANRHLISIKGPGGWNITDCRNRFSISLSYRNPVQQSEFFVHPPPTG